MSGGEFERDVRDVLELGWSAARSVQEDPEFIPRDRLFPPYGSDPEGDPDGLLEVEYLPPLPGEPGYRPDFMWHEEDDDGA